MSQLTPSQLNGLTFPTSSVSQGPSNGSPGTQYFYTTNTLTTGSAISVSFSAPNDATNAITMTYNGGKLAGQAFVLKLVANDAGDFLLQGSAPPYGSPFGNGSTFVVNSGSDPTGSGRSVAALSPSNNYVACFVRGTRILTPAGQVLVETLAIGDLVTTIDGSVLPVKWIGRRSYDGKFIALNVRILPVLVQAGALSDGIPQRDLQLSPKHALLIDGLLMPSEALVNGVSIRQLDSVDTVHYFHVELQEHAVLLAEGAPAESFIENQSRSAFQNAAEFEALYPHDLATVTPCAERWESGEPVEAARARLATRAGLTPLAEAGTLGLLRGCVDIVSIDAIAGWANDASDAPVRLEILDHGIVIARIIANAIRPDVAEAGAGPARCGFIVRNLGLDRRERHVISLRRTTDRAQLTDEAYVIEAALLHDPARIVAFGSTLRATAAAARVASDLDYAIAFLENETGKLRNARLLLAS